MKYKNTKTGAIIDSPCEISGGDWITESDEVGMEINKSEAADGDEVIDLSQMTLAELRGFAVEAGLDLGKATKKEEIIKIITESDEVEMELK